MITKYDDFITEGYIDDFKKRFFKKKSVENPKKEDLWMINPSVKLVDQKTIPNFSCYIDKLEEFGGDDGPNSKKTFNIENLSKKRIRESFNFDLKLGQFTERRGEIGRKNYSGWFSSIGRLRSFYSESKIFDIYKYFPELHKISDKLGYKIGSEVYIKQFDNTGKITEIIDVCLYGHKKIPSLNLMYDNIDIALTLAFKVDNQYYLIDKIEIVNDVKNISLSKDEILDFFIDMKDDEKIEFKYSIQRDRESEYYKCNLNFTPKLNSELFTEFNICYNRMVKGLKNQSMKVELMSISMEQVVFNIKPEKIL